MLRIVLKIRLKSGEIKTIIFGAVTDLYIDYENNRLSLFDYLTGVDYKYHFRETGNERDGEATEILDMQITKREED